MKTLNVTFTTKEYQALVESKDKSGLNWHDFILTLGDSKEES